MKKQRKKKKVKDVYLMKSANLDVASIILKARYLRVLAQKTKINTNATNIMMIDGESFLKCSTFKNIFFIDFLPCSLFPPYIAYMQPSCLSIVGITLRFNIFIIV